MYGLELPCLRVPGLLISGHPNMPELKTKLVLFHAA